MEQSPLETSYEELKALQEETHNNLRWVMAITSVLIQEAGGVVYVDRHELERVDVSKARVEVSYDAEKEAYKVEGIYNDAV